MAGEDVKAARIRSWGAALAAVLGVLVGATPSLLDAWQGSGGVRLPDAVAAQLAEDSRHFHEEPAVVREAYQDGRWRIEEAVYASDLCVNVRRVPLLDSIGPEVSSWNLHPKPGAPPTFATASLFSSPAFASGGSQCVERGCLERHAGKFTEKREATRDECWVRVVRRWEDGCSYWRLYNVCQSYWQGAPCWTKCVHGGNS